MNFPARLATACMLPAIAALSACGGLPARAPYGSAASCSGSGLRIDADFERGALASCRVESGERVVLEIAPETVPINDSAWYAFRLRAARPQTVEVRLQVRDGTFRYAPKTSTDRETWTVLPPERLAVDADRKGATLRLDVGRRPLLVAAQPLESIADALDALRPALRRAGFAERVIGRTHDGRPVLAFERVPAGAKGLVVLLGRQHPPETTGAEAYTAFVRRLLELHAEPMPGMDALGLLLVPVMNPDGIARGHWRGNAAGTDLNRDWAGYAEPEVRAVATHIEQLAARVPPVALLDFHSTRRDVIYAAPQGAAGRDLAELFLEELDRRLGPLAPPVERSHNAGLATAKSWALERYSIGGLTYEVGDATPPARATQDAQVAAEALYAASYRHLVAPRQPAFVFTGWAGPPVPVWSHRPAGAGPDAKLVFVMHGVGRDADRYLAEWIALADAQRFIVVVPEFSRAAFPGTDGYNLGGTQDADGRPVPRAAWSYSLLEPLFDELVRREGLTARGYALYGHSAGAQYVHRYVLLGAGRRVERAVAANSGWYAFADETIGWPYGLGGAPAVADLATAFATPLTVLLGDADTDPAHESLRRTPEADAQGRHRYERGQRFYDGARRGAAARGVPFRWSCAVAPGVGHDNARAARHAVPLLLGAPVVEGGDCAPVRPVAAAR